MIIDPEKDHAPIDGAPEEIPDTVTAFRISRGITKKFTCTLNRAFAGSTYQFVVQYRDTMPPLDEIPTQFGHGRYQFVFMWKGKGPDGKSMHENETFDMEFAEIPWKSIHLRYIAEQERLAKEELERQTGRAVAEAQLDSAKKGILPGTGAKSEMDVLKNAMGTLRDLGVPIGGVTQASPMTFDKIIGYATAAMAILGPIFKGMFDNSRAREETQTKLLIALMAGKGGDDTMGKALESVMKLVGVATQAKEMLLPAPEEKETLMDKLFGILEVLGPKVLEMAAMNQQQRQANPLWNMAAGSPQLKTIAGDPALQAKLVQRLDESYGFQGAQSILEALAEVGISRPAELADNWKKHPSPGYGIDGQALPANPTEHTHSVSG